MILFVNCGNQELEIHDNNTTYLKDCPIWVDAVQTVAVYYHKLPVRGNKRRAQAMLEEYKNSFAIPEPEAENPEINLDMYFTDYLKKWLELIRSTVQETTYGGYSSIINRTVIPYFEKKYLRLGEVRPIDLQGFLNAMGDKDIKPATIHHY